MIKFFRKIRYDLMSSGKTSKYLKYAIGEIFLVVLGILIALQINNWNENRKDTELAEQYLKSIKNDLKKDLKLLDSLLILYSKEISIIRNIDGAFNSERYENGKYQGLFVETDTTVFKNIFYRGFSFRSIKGSYNSLISDGKSSLIKNRELFEAIQSIYEEHYDRMESVYETTKPSQDRIHWSYPLQKKHWGHSDLIKAKNDKIFLDLANFTEIKYFYAKQLFDLKEESKKVINLINQELTGD